MGGITKSFHFMLRALKHRNYRIFFTGQIVSLIGTWLSMVATSWLVYRIADRSVPEKAALILGIVGFCSQIPIFFLSPLAGVWIDRWNRHYIIIATQFLSMLQSFVLAYLTLKGVITVPHIILLSIVQGILNAIDMPTRQALVVDIIERREDLSNAIALNSSMVHTARLVGPAFAGFLIYHFGEGICFLIDGFSYLAVLFGLLVMNVPRKISLHASQHPIRSLMEGFRYAFGFLPVRTVLLFIAMVSLASMAQTALMPLFADRIVGGGERSLGLLLGSSGFGALVGSLYLASRKTVLGLGKVMIASSALLGASLVLFSFSHWLFLSVIFTTLSGFGVVVAVASANTILQTIVDDDKRGRVMSLFTMAFLGVAPFSNLLAGALADHFGAPRALAFHGVLGLLAAFYFGHELAKVRDWIRPIYLEKGIIEVPPAA